MIRRLLQPGYLVRSLSDSPEQRYSQSETAKFGGALIEMLGEV